jgi:hypothetical protein
MIVHWNKVLKFDFVVEMIDSKIWKENCFFFENKEILHVDYEIEEESTSMVPVAVFARINVRVFRMKFIFRNILVRWFHVELVG